MAVVEGLGRVDMVVQSDSDTGLFAWVFYGALQVAST